MTGAGPPVRPLPESPPRPPRPADAQDEPIREIAPGTWSLRIPAPEIPVQFTFSYVIEGSAGVIIVDPGWDSPRSEAVLRQSLSALGIRPGAIVGVVATHSHRDHIGLAHSLGEAGHAPPWIGAHPADAGPTAEHADVRAFRTEERRMLAALGVPDAAMAKSALPDDGAASILATVRATRALRDGDILPLEGRRIRVVHTPGHTPGSLCLVDEDLRLVFTGDTVLPRISPNLGWWPDAAPDPVGDYFGSLERLRAFDGYRVLPGHEWHFDDLAARLDWLADHHADRAAEVGDALSGRRGASPWQVAETLTWSRDWATLTPFQHRIAAAETAAHLAHLVARGDAILVAPARFAAVGSPAPTASSALAGP